MSQPVSEWINDVLSHAEYDPVVDFEKAILQDLEPSIDGTVGILGHPPEHRPCDVFFANGMKNRGDAGTR